MEFVYSVNNGNVAWGPGSTVNMSPDDVWFADDPFVVARPDLFSRTPLRAHSTVGRDVGPATMLTTASPELEVAAPRRGRPRA